LPVSPGPFVQIFTQYSVIRYSQYRQKQGNGQIPVGEWLICIYNLTKVSHAEAL
jgi:hypothetical protein